MKLEPQEIESALDELLRAVLALPGLAAELEHSRREYFPRGEPVQPDDESRRAARRHREWFLLERPSAALGGVPVEWALHRRDDLPAGELGEDVLRALLASSCSVFQVTGVAEGEGVWLRDLAGMGEYPLNEPEGSLALSSDDVIVGRLFAIGESLYRVSPAAGVFRNGKLLRALLADFERLRQARRGVLRLSQAELEAMFWRRIEPTGADPVALARAQLLSGGVTPDEADEILAELERTPFDGAQVLVGADDTLGAILERLAFDTRVDLDVARRVLFDAWAVLAGVTGAAPAPPAPPPLAEGRRDAHSAIEAFDRGRREGRDLEVLFQQLERDLELESECYDPDAIDGAPAPDFPGVVGAMVEEFLWETGRTRGEAAAREAEVLRAFSEFGADYGVFENLGQRELVLFAAVWLPERRTLGTPSEARHMLAALKGFCAWSQENQDVALLDAYQRALAPLESSLPRLVEAQRWCVSDAGAPSQVFELVALGAARSTVRDAQGDEYEVELEPRLKAALAIGDRLRARRVAGARLDVFCCYPAESAVVAQ